MNADAAFWRALLVKYMRLVADCEGATFVRGGAGRRPGRTVNGNPDEITPAEACVLEQIEREIDP